jgi:hypothetical protein
MAKNAGTLEPTDQWRRKRALKKKTQKLAAKKAKAKAKKGPALNKLAKFAKLIHLKLKVLYVEWDESKSDFVLVVPLWDPT